MKREYGADSIRIGGEIMEFEYEVVKERKVTEIKDDGKKTTYHYKLESLDGDVTITIKSKEMIEELKSNSVFKLVLKKEQKLL